jgi:hypothetical protein
MDVLDRYIAELSVDTALNEFTMKEVQMKLPGIKHKWAGRLMRSKLDKEGLIRKRRQLISKMSNELIERSPIKLSFPIAKQKVQEHDTITDMDEDINNKAVIIEFLEKAERILNSMTFDIKNLTEIMKLELQ